MKEPHHNAATNIPTTPDVKIKHQGQVDGAVHARSGNHNQTVAREAGTGEHSPICVSFPRLILQKKAVERQADSLKLRTRPFLSERTKLAHQPDEAVSETTRLSDSHGEDFKQIVLGVRQFAADVLAAQGIRCEITTLLDLERIQLTAEQCHHIFLIFKEVLHYLARHNHCTATTLSVSVTHQRLLVEIRDERCSLIGKLLDPSTASARTGDERRNLQERMIELRGALEMASAPGWGTKLTLTIPFRQLMT